MREAVVKLNSKCGEMSDEEMARVLSLFKNFIAWIRDCELPF